jgi:dipeptidyl aminopeptidase/acylaminoacyl peptidase
VGTRPPTCTQRGDVVTDPPDPVGGPTMGAPRGMARRMLDVWGFTPGFTVPHEDVVFHARDGVRLVASYLPIRAPIRAPTRAPIRGATAPPRHHVPAVVLAHGFAGHRTKPAYAYLAERLSADAAVLSLDLRGHGSSGGRCTFGDHEALDLRAAAAWLRRHGHAWVGVVGASMGGAAALRAAGEGPPGAFDAVAAISVVAVWGLADTPAMRVLTRIATDPWHRAVASVLLRVRIAARWAEPRSPLDVVGRIAPTPLLLVHGADDHFFSAEQSLLLAAAAGPPCTRWLEPAGFGHAEDGFTYAFIRRLREALRRVHAIGDWGPSRLECG